MCRIVRHIRGGAPCDLDRCRECDVLRHPAPRGCSPRFLPLPFVSPGAAPSFLLHGTHVDTSTHANTHTSSNTHAHTHGHPCVVFTCRLPPLPLHQIRLSTLTPSPPGSAPKLFPVADGLRLSNIIRCPPLLHVQKLRRPLHQVTNSARVGMSCSMRRCLVVWFCACADFCVERAE